MLSNCFNDNSRSMPPLEAETDGADGAMVSSRLICASAQSLYFVITYWSDGLRIKGYLGLPKKGAALPAIIYNRGGNRELGALSGPEIVPYVEAGYITVASQYRGSTGSEGREEFGGADLNDVLNLIPLLQGLPQFDGERLGMVGVSRGGMMTYLALKRLALQGSNRIKVASTVGGIADVINYAEKRTDIRLLCRELIGADYDDVPAAYEARSAVCWPECINAPLLLQHGEADWRVAVDPARRLAELLSQAGKVVELLTYPGDDHALTANEGGLPATLAWLHQYIGGPEQEKSYARHQQRIAAVVREWPKKPSSLQRK